jgi:cytochrome P450
MTLYPEVQRKAQAEIDRVIGNSRLPDYSDQDELPYVDAVLKEVLRWHPVTPLGMFLVSMPPQHQLNKIASCFAPGHEERYL